MQLFKSPTFYFYLWIGSMSNVKLKAYTRTKRIASY